jgi:hypothetical protein
MKISRLAALTVTVASSALSLGLGGCAAQGDGRVVNTRQPGPAIGTGVGIAAGAVAGNVAGAAVGAADGFAGGASTAFDGTRRVVRTWRTETTADGRTLQVPVEIEVDENGRPYHAPKK